MASKRFDDCFVGVSFPRAPVTFLFVIHYFESPATTFRLVNHICLSTVTYVAKGAPQEFCVVTAREGIRARMDGKILGTPVILTYTS